LREPSGTVGHGNETDDWSTMSTTEAPAGLATLDEARVDLAIACRAAALYDLNEGIDNHFSLALEGVDDQFMLNRFGPHWSEMSASDILTIDTDGTVISGEGEWETTAFMIHRAIHQAHASARCILHTHMPFATAVSLLEEGLDTRLSQNAMFFHGQLAYADYDGLATEAADGGRLSGAFGNGVSAVVLRNHGVLALGTSVADAWMKLYFLERACQAQIRAQSTGRKLVRVPDSVAVRTAAAFAESAVEGAPAFFAAVKRRLDRENPGYAS
jgi:ribulose-5-phosphate 4-epimerase/fuculose-1-phosphate aldolase